MLQEAGYTRARALTGGWAALLAAGKGVVEKKT
jgi:hypothetical protein